MSINKCGSLTEQDLETIYELTYKYGWLVSEERQEGWLGDRAVMEKFRIEEAVNEWMPYGLEGMLETYTEWLDGHEEESWIASFEDDELNNIVAFLGTRWDIDYEDDLFEAVAESFGSDRDFLIEMEDEGSLIETYAEQYLDNVVDKEEGYEKQEQMEKEIEDVGHENYFNKHYDIYAIIDWLIDDMGWTTKEHLKEIYRAEDLIVTFEVNIDIRPFLKKMYQKYLDHFSGIEDEITGIQIMQDKIENALSADLQEQIITFQEGLTTAHHHGTMADHLLQVQVGSGVAILDKMSSGLNMDLWNRDLEGVLGKQLFEE